MASMIQLFTLFPFKKTSQAPQSPRSQPDFGLFTPSLSRRTASNISVGSTCTNLVSPFMFIDIFFNGMHFNPISLRQPLRKGETEISLS